MNDKFFTSAKITLESFAKQLQFLFGSCIAILAAIFSVVTNDKLESLLREKCYILILLKLGFVLFGISLISCGLAFMKVQSLIVNSAMLNQMVTSISQPTQKQSEIIKDQRNKCNKNAGWVSRLTFSSYVVVAISLLITVLPITLIIIFYMGN